MSALLAAIEDAITKHVELQFLARAEQEATIHLYPAREGVGVSVEVVLEKEVNDWNCLSFDMAKLVCSVSPMCESEPGERGHIAAGLRALADRIGRGES
jgi:hypothetical protein